MGRTWLKEEVTKRKIWILFWIQKKCDFSEVSFQCIFNDFGFLLISMKINLHVWFYSLSSLQYFISLEGLFTWSQAFCSLWASASCCFIESVLFPIKNEIHIPLSRAEPMTFILFISLLLLSPLISVVILIIYLAVWYVWIKKSHF